MGGGKGGVDAEALEVLLKHGQRASAPAARATASNGKLLYL
jgi:hypothetical protein